MSFLRQSSRKFWDLIVAHRLVVASGVVLYLFLIFPLFIFPIAAEDYYKGIDVIYTSAGNADAVFYLAKGKEVLEGHSLGNLFLKEGKNRQDINFSNAERIPTLPLKLLGLADKVDIVTVYNIYGFICLMVIIFLIYAFVFRISRDKLLSTLIPIVIIGAYLIIKDKALGYPESNMYLRPIQPATNIITLFIYLHLLYSAIKNNDRKFLILSGLMFGMLFYVAYFVWSFALAITGMLFLLYVFIKKDFVLAKRLLTILFFGLFIGSFRLWSLYKFYSGDVGKITIFFLAAAKDHTPIFHRMPLIATTFLFVIFGRRYKFEDYFWLFLAIILASWAALNQQIITGIQMQPDHYDQYFIIPFSFLISLYVLSSFVANKKARIFIFIFFTVVVSYSVFLSQWRYADKILSQRMRDQNYREIIDFLNKENGQKVILTAENNISGLLFSVYTQHDLFWTPLALLFDVPNMEQRTEEAICVNLYFDKESRAHSIGDKVLNPIRNNLVKCCQDTYVSYSAYKSGLSDLITYRLKEESDDSILVKKRSEIDENILEKCRNIAGDDIKVMQILDKYNVDYIVWDKVVNPNWDVSFIKGIKRVSSGSSIDLYRIEDNHN